MKKLLVLAVFTILFATSTSSNLSPEISQLLDEAIPKPLSTEAAGILGSTETMLQVPSKTSARSATISVETLVLGASTSPSMGSIQTDSMDSKLILDSDQTTNTLRGSGFAINFTALESARVNSILLPSFTNWKSDSWNTVSISLSTNLTGGYNFFSFIIQKHVLTSASNNMLLIPLSSQLGGPNEVQINASNSLFLKLEFSGNTVDVSARVSSDSTGTNENQVYVLNGGTWTEVEGTDLSAIFLATTESLFSTPQQSQFNVTVTKGLTLIQSVYNDGSGGSFYDPSVAWDLIVYDNAGLDLTVNPNFIGRGLDTNISVQVSAASTFLGNQFVESFIIEWETREILCAGYTLTDSVGTISLRLNFNKTSEIGVSITNTSLTGLKNISVIEPQIVISNWDQRATYGSGSLWNETVVTVELRALWNPGGNSVVNGSVRIFLNKTLVTEGSTNTSGWFKGQFTTYLVAGNYNSILKVKINANNVQLSSNYNLSISKGKITPILLNPSEPFSRVRSLIFMLKNSFENSIIGANVTAILDNQSRFNSSDSQGLVNISFENVSPGIHYVSLEIQIPSYQSFQNTFQINVTTGGIQVEPAAWEITPYYGDSYTVSGRLIDASGSPVPNAEIRFVAKLKLEDVILNPEVKYFTDPLGTFSASIWDNFSETSFLLSIEVVGVNDSDVSYAIIRINKQPIPTVIDLEVMNSTFPNMPFAKGKLLDIYGRPLSGRELKVRIETVDYFISTNETGWFEFGFPSLQAGEYLVNVSYSPVSTANETSSFNQTMVLVAKGILEISLQNQSLEGIAGKEFWISGILSSDGIFVSDYLITLLNETGSELARGSTDTMGRFNVSILLSGSLGVRSLTVVAFSSVNYQGTNQTVLVNVTRVVPQIKPLFASVIDFSPSLSLEFLVMDQANNPLHNVTVQLTIDNETLSATTSPSGVASFSSNLLPGTYAYVASINDTISLAGISISSTISIDSLKVSVGVIQETFVSGVAGSIGFQLVYENGTPYSNSFVVLINGSSYSLFSNSSGWAVLSITLSEGNYTIEVHDSWGSSFAIFPASVSVEKEMILVNANIPSEIALDGLMEFNVSLQTNAGLVLSNTSVRIEIMNASTILFFVIEQTDSTGVARFGFPFPENISTFSEQLLGLRIYVVKGEMIAEQTREFRLVAGQIIGHVSVNSLTVAKDVVAVIEGTNRIGRGISFLASGYLDGTLVFTTNIVNSSEITFSILDKGNYTLVVVFEKQGYLQSIISVNFEVQGIDVNIRVIDYFAQYLNNQSFLEVELRFANGSVATGYGIQLWIADIQIGVMTTDLNGIVRFQLPDGYWGTYGISLRHDGTSITNPSILDTTIFFERASISLVLTPGYANGSSILWVDLLINEQTMQLDEAIGLYWKDSQETLWRLVNIFPGTTGFIDYGTSNQIDLRIDDTSRFVGVSLQHTISTPSTLDISLLSEPIVLEDMELLVSSNGKALVNTEVSLGIESNNTIKFLQLTTNSQGILKIKWSNFSSSPMVNLTIYLWANNSVTSQKLTVSFALRPWLVELSFNENGTDGMWIRILDRFDSAWLSNDFEATISINGSNIQSIRNQVLFFLERDYLPSSRFVQVSVRLKDYSGIYLSSTHETMVEQPLSIFISVLAQTVEIGDNLTTSLNISVSYWNESVENILLEARLSDGRLLGSSVLKTAVLEGMILKTSEMDLGFYSVVINGYLPNGEKIATYSFDLEVVKEKVRTSVFLENNGYGQNITVQIRITDNDNSTVADGSIKVTIAFEGKVLTSTRLLISEIGDEWQVTLPHFMTNGTLTVVVAYEPFLFSLYEQARFETSFVITPEVPLLTIVEGEARFGEHWEVILAAKGEHNQSLPFVTLEFVDYNVTITTDEKGFATLSSIDLEPGMHSISVFASYEGYDKKVSFYFSLYVEKRIIPLSYENAMTASLGETLTLTLPYLPEGKANYTISVFDGETRVYVESFPSGTLEFNTRLLDKTGMFLLVVERFETTLTSYARAEITLNIEKASTVIGVTDSRFYSSSLVLQGTLQTTASTGLDKEKIILLLYEEEQLVAEFSTITNDGYWEFEIALNASNALITVKLAYLGSDKYDETSLIALQFIPNDVMDLGNRDFGFSNFISSSDSTLAKGLAIFLVPVMGFGLEQFVRKVRRK